MVKANSDSRSVNLYDAVARLLTRTLTVPEIFFEARWPDSRHHVDILAIDRAGSGDLHIVEVISPANLVTTSAVRQLSAVPAHFRWIAIQVADERSNPQILVRLAESGIGAISIFTTANRQETASILAKPRRATSFDRKMVGNFLSGTVPDIEYGEAPPASVKMDITPLPKESIKRYLDEADQLLASGHERAAYLLAWSAIEAAMKLVIGGGEQGPMPSSRVLVRAVQEIGRATSSEANSLAEALDIRNALAHGLNSPPGASKAYKNATAIARNLVEPSSAKNKRRQRRQIA